MQEETLLLTQNDRDRLKVLHEVRKGHITQRQASEQLKLTDRWIRELVERIREKGDKAVIHGLRGTRSKRKIAEKIEKQAMEIVGREYADFGPTLASEYLNGITKSRPAGRQCGNGCCERVSGRGASNASRRYMSGERGGVVSANWCSGTHRIMTGWKGAGRACI